MKIHNYRNFVDVRYVGSRSSDDLDAVNNIWM
jgi:hypothetical protein